MKSMSPLPLKTIVIVTGLVVCLAMPALTFTADLPELKASFVKFLNVYIREIKQGNTGYLEGVHPHLPEEMRSFFIGITVDMMKYADENGLLPEITCREYEICKATWPQPGDSWAAQTFVRHEGKWQWLEY